MTADAESPRRVMFESDANGITLVSVAVYSVLRNSDRSRPVDILMAHDDTFVAAGGKAKIENVVKRFPHATVEFSDFMPIYKPLARRLERADTRWPPMVWGWVFCDRLFPGVGGKIVYIDLDTYVTGDLQELFDVDLASGGHLMAMVAESRRPDDDFCNVKWTTSDPALYNTGVILLDIDAWRREDMAMKIADWFAEHREDVPFVEQDAANFVCQGRILRLPLKWNYNDNSLRSLGKVDVKGGTLFEGLHPPREAIEAMAYPKIVHYMFTHKPDRYNHRPERNLFRRAMIELGMTSYRLPGETLPRLIEGWLHDMKHSILRRRARRMFSAFRG